MNSVCIGKLSRKRAEVHSLPENSVSIHIYEKEKITVYFSAFLLFTKVLYPGAQTSGVAHIGITVGGDDGHTLAFIGVGEGIKGDFVGKLRHDGAEGIKGNCAVVKTECLYSELIVKSYLRGGKHNLLRTDYFFAFAENVPKTASVFISNGEVDAFTELILGHS